MFILSRLRITVTSKGLIPEIEMDRHHIQSFIYSCLSDLGDTHLHAGNHFRHFSFGIPYPSGDLYNGKEKNFIISSPDTNIIKKLKEAFEQRNEIWFGKSRATIEAVKLYDFNVPNVFQTGSPIVLYKNNRKNSYYSLKNGDPLSKLMIRMKENAVKRYKDFSRDTDFEFNRPLFDNIVFQREVVVPITKGGSIFSIVGTTYYRLERLRFSRSEYNLYRYILDAGLGEKTSFGFGLLNPIKRKVNDIAK